MSKEKILKTLEQEENELWLRAKIVLQFVEIRERKKLSQQDVADIMGVSKQLISRFERMENSPTLSFLSKYADALDADINTIILMKNIQEISINDQQLEKMNNVISYSNGEISIDVNFDYENETIWLTQAQIAELYQVDRTRITRHINNIYNDCELIENSTCAENAQVQFEGNRKVIRNIKFYNLDMIISIGYRVNSKRGIEFRRWVTNILKQYMYKGYVLNKKRLEVLNKVVEIQNKMLANTLDVETSELKNIIDLYTNALTLLDNYDHQCVSKPSGNKADYVLSYEECRNFINNMRFVNDSSVFGVEKSKGQLDGILACINQTAFGEEVYKSLEEKAANLLYFIVKDHPFVDGCKRIAAGLFLLYLSKNAMLSKNKLTISNGALTAITLLVAESKPEEKEIMIRIIMNILFNKM